MANKFRDKPIQTKVEELEEVEIFEEVEEPVNEKPKKPVKKGVLAKGLSKIFGGGFLSNDRAVEMIPFIMFLALIAVFYIGNGYYADDKIREVNKTSNEIKELRTEYISSKSDLMFVSKQSEIAKRVEKLGLKEPVVAPMKIETDSILTIKK
jgi:hypothetical protein